MSQLTSVPQLVAAGYDQNRDQWVHDDLQVPGDVQVLAVLGGDRQVSVDELAKAIESDKVVIRNRNIELVRGPIEVPNLFADAEAVHPYAEQAVRMTERFAGDLVTPAPPQRAAFADEASFQAAQKEFNTKIDSFESAVKGDRYMLMGAIQTVLLKAKDPEVRRTLQLAMFNVAINDLDDYFKKVRLGQAQGDVYAKDRAVMRKGLQSVAQMTDFTPPRLALERLNASLSKAEMAVSQEKRLVHEHRDQYLKQAEAKLQELQQKGGALNWLAAQRLKGKIAQAKAADPEQLSNKLHQVSRLAYESTVAAWSLASRDDARVLSHDSRTFGAQAAGVEKQARDDVRAIEGLQ